MAGVYRFLRTPRWLGFAALMVALAATMVGLGFWQLDRYHQRAAVNHRIDAAARADPVPVTRVLSVGQAPPASVAWTRVTMTGRYDPDRQIIARDRTVNGSVGFEILDAFRLADGTGVLIDRGWLAATGSGSATAVPRIPPVPSGEVTIVGRVHLPESRATAATTSEDRLEVRRVSPAKLADTVSYPLLGGYVLLDDQQPVANDKSFTDIPADYENSAMNAGYVVQWWAFALLTLIGFGWAARREARGPEPDYDLSTLDAADFPEAPVSPAV